MAEQIDNMTPLLPEGAEDLHDLSKRRGEIRLPHPCGRMVLPGVVSDTDKVDPDQGASGRANRHALKNSTEMFAAEPPKKPCAFPPQMS